MGFFNFLFGSKPKTEVETKSTLSPQQEALASFLGPALQRNVLDPTSIDPSGFGTTPPDAFNLSLANLENLGNLAFDQLDFSNSIASGLTGLPTGSDLFGGSGALGFDQGSDLSFLKDVFARGPTDFQDFFNTNVRDPLLDQFQDTILPGISRRQGLEGHSTSGRVDQDRRATDAILRELTRSQADLAFRTAESDKALDAQIGRAIADASGQDASRFLQAILSDDALRAQLAGQDADRGLNTALGAGDLANQALDAISNALGAQLAGGAAAAQFGQQNADRQLQIALANAGFDQNAIQQAIQFLATQQSENIVKNTPGQTGIIPSLLGTEAGAGAAVSGISKLVGLLPFFSDERLKENMVEIGKFNGIPFYAFDWNVDARQLGLSGRGIGVSAQEAMLFSPHAVSTDPRTGYLQVKYGEI